MDKPEALPEKYLQIAADVMPEGSSFAQTCAVARAILSAQSQAYIDAARIAEEYAKIHPEYPEFDAIHNAGIDISAAILQRKEEIGR